MAIDTSLVSDAPAAGSAPSPRADARPWARLFRAASGKDVLAVLDQAVVSGTSFLTSILLWRYCGPGDFGVYSLGFSLLVTWGCVQESLIATPYTIFRLRPLRGTPAEYAGAVLLHQGLLSAAALLSMAAVGGILSLTDKPPGLASVIWVLALATPFALLREFGRRFAFAHLGMVEALVLDGAVSALQLAGLVALGWAGALTAGTAFAALGLACALTAGAWLYYSRDEFALRGGDWRPALKQSWALGKWIVAGQVTLAVQAYFIYWLLFFAVSKEATGVYAACMQIALFSNPLILGISNALAPRTAHAFTEGGGGELRRVVSRTTILLAAAMAMFCVAVFVGGDQLMAVLYRGVQFAGQEHIVAVLALGMFATAVGMPASNGLTAVERADVVFKVGVVAIVISVVLTPPLVGWWGVTGAAYGFLAGNVVGAVGRWVAFCALVMKRGSPVHVAAVTRVLQQVVPGSGEGGWVIEPLNEGAQASIFTARPADDTPAWRGERELVVKLFKPAARERVEEVRAQVRSMARFHAKLDGSTADGWRMHAPVPLHHCDRPFALVMTRVPGVPLNECIADGRRLTPDALAAIADGVVAGMERTWAVESQIHGDFNFDNILCDLPGRTLSFVDPGVREDVPGCDAVPRRWYPASRDLAHLLFETEAGVKRSIGTPAVRRRQRTLAEQVLRAYLRRAVPAGERAGLLDEVHACARVYLASLEPSWTPRGVWRRFVRRVATRRIDEVVRRLRAEADEIGPARQAGPSRVQSAARQAAPTLQVLAALDRAGVGYCLPHGCGGSDVDCVTDVSPDRVAAVLRDAGLTVVRCLSGHVVVAGRDADGSPHFVDLDVSADYELDGRRFYSGPEILAGRRRHGPVWVPAPAIEFGCTLVRRIAKGSLPDEPACRLGDLYRQDGAGCREQISRFWPADSAAVVAAAAESGDWEPVRRDLPRLRRDLLRRTMQPLRQARHRLARLARRVNRYFRPVGGVGVVFLGPDGAGKSSVIAGIRGDLAGVFPTSMSLSFPPAILRRLLGRPEGPVTLPHALPPRSPAASVLRAILYWLPYYTLGHWLAFRPALARSALVVHDRHAVDALVDAARYRYAGPRWPLRLIWRLAPKPDLVILLHAPAAVLQARKQEVPFDVTARQADAYRGLVAGMPNGHVVDAARPLDRVAADVSDLILRHLADRVRRGRAGRGRR